MISVEEAQKLIADLLRPVGTEEVALSEAGNRVMRKSAKAERDQPPFAASAMDGYAIRKSDLAAGKTLTVIGEIAAGHFTQYDLAPGQAVRIFTGGALPKGADYILIQEDTDRSGDQITVRANFDTNPYVRPAGGDFRKGFELPAPRAITHADVALLAAMNQPKITVSMRPVVALIPTGDELVWPGETPRSDQIISSNNFGLKAMLEAEGAEVRLMPIAADTIAALNNVFELSRDADLIITLGGASVGDHDLVQNTAQSKGLELAFYKLAMRPGKPLMAGMLGDTPMIGLPGNPVSSMVCAHVFIRPAIRALLGLGYTCPPSQTAVLTKDIGPNGKRAHYMRAIVKQSDGGWHCTPNERQDSSLLGVLSQSNALMIRPVGDPARKSGDVVKFTHL